MNVVLRVDIPTEYIMEDDGFYYDQYSNIAKNPGTNSPIRNR